MTQPVIRRIDVYSDGSSSGNRGPAGIAFSIYENEICTKKRGRYIGDATNNEAEYLALLWAMDEASSFGRVHAVFHLDSELVARQFSGVYKTRDSRMRQLSAQVKEKSKLFDVFEIRRTPRGNSKIQEVDDLAKRCTEIGRDFEVSRGGV